jgi:hypothetical protein
MFDFNDIVFRERIILENKSLVVHGEFLVAVSLDLVKQVTLDESAWIHCLKYRKNVSVLVEKDSEDKSGKSGEISEDIVILNESRAISGIGYVHLQDDRLRRIQTTPTNRNCAQGLEIQTRNEITVFQGYWNEWSKCSFVIFRTNL